MDKLTEQLIFKVADRIQSFYDGDTASLPRNDVIALLRDKCNQLINSVKEECAMIAETWKSDIYNPTTIDINAYIEENAKLIAKAIRDKE